MDDIIEEINSLVEKHKTRDPFELCSALGIIVTKLYLPPSINGIYQYERKNQFIYINNTIKPISQLITCSQGLCHAICHKKYNCIFIKSPTLNNKNKIERAANIFAAQLIIPDESLELNGQTISEKAIELNVPEELLQLKLASSKFF